jgi:hypothetical protein
MTYAISCARKPEEICTWWIRGDEASKTNKWKNMQCSMVARDTIVGGNSRTQNATHQLTLGCLKYQLAHCMCARWKQGRKEEIIKGKIEKREKSDKERKEGTINGTKKPQKRGRDMAQGASQQSRFWPNFRLVYVGFVENKEAPECLLQ